MSTTEETMTERAALAEGLLMRLSDQSLENRANERMRVIEQRPAWQLLIGDKPRVAQPPGTTNALKSTTTIVSVDTKNTLTHVEHEDGTTSKLAKSDVIEVERIARTPLALIAGSVLTLRGKFDPNAVVAERRKLLDETIAGETNVTDAFRWLGAHVERDCRLKLNGELALYVERYRSTLITKIISGKWGSWSKFAGNDDDESTARMWFEVEAWVRSMRERVDELTGQLMRGYHDPSSSSHHRSHEQHEMRAAARDHVDELSMLLQMIERDVARALTMKTTDTAETGGRALVIANMLSTVRLAHDEIERHES